MRHHRLPRACRPSPGPRWPTSQRACTRRSRSWRCCSPRGGRSEGAAAPSVELSLFDVMTDVMGYAADLHPALRRRPAAAGRRARPRWRRTARFRTRDGQTVVLGTTNDREWQRLARRDHRARRPGRRPAVRAPTPTAARTATSSTRPSDPGARSTISPTSRRRPMPRASATPGTTCPSEVVVHPQLTARDRWRTVDTPKGDIQALLPPPVIAGYRAADGRGARAG